MNGAGDPSAAPPLISATVIVPFSEAKAAFAHMASGAHFGKVAIKAWNGHGGKRPGAGRPKGASSRANEQVREEAAATGELPLAPAGPFAAPVEAPA